MTFLLSLLAAFAGGLILNVMPCVLPVLTLKAFTVLEHAHGDRHRQKLHGFAYAVGTISAFTVFALVVSVLRASGKSLGWGLQFQHPPFVATMTALVVAFALNALGVFDVTLSFTGKQGKDGVAGSIANGWFAALMATPCSAPFLGTAAIFALNAHAAWWQTLVVFVSIGAGLASPFVALALVPGLARYLPRPGAWMETFKQLMGFSLLATAVWLFGVLQKQVTSDSATLFLAFLLVLTVCLWAVQRFGGLTQSTKRRMLVRLMAGVVLLAAIMRLVRLERASSLAHAATDENESVIADGRIRWAPFNAERVKRELARGRPVFLDFTAEWCASCKTNEKVVLETEAVRDALLRTGVLPMKADMTNENDEIAGWLARLGRTGIPAYVVHYPDGSHDLLPVSIGSDTVVRSLENAAHKYPASRYVSVPTG